MDPWSPFACRVARSPQQDSCALNLKLSRKTVLFAQLDHNNLASSQLLLCVQDLGDSSDNDWVTNLDTEAASRQ